VQKEWGHSGYPAPLAPGFGSPDARKCCGSPLEALEWMLEMQTAPSETAAIILEPVLGEGGFLTPPPGFLRGLREICTKHGIMLIADEVQSGAGRTGTWWAHEQFDGGAMDPDMIIFAKGIASGYPFAGLAARADAFDKLAPGTMGGTYGGNAVSCAAAVATIDVIEKEGVLANVAARGEQLMTGACVRVATAVVSTITYHMSV
jgi:4-aminobutyrate aminotransferase